MDDVDILQVLYEVRVADRESLVPPALNPTTATRSIPGCDLSHCRPAATSASAWSRCNRCK